MTREHRISTAIITAYNLRKLLWLRILVILFLLSAILIFFINDAIKEYSPLCPDIPDFPDEQTISKDLSKRYTLKILDTERDPLSTEEITEDLLGKKTYASYPNRLEKARAISLCLKNDSIDEIFWSLNRYALDCMKKQLSFTKKLLQGNDERIQLIVKMYDPQYVNYYNNFNNIVSSAQSMQNFNENIAIFGIKQTGKNIPIYNLYKKSSYIYHRTKRKNELYMQIYNYRENSPSEFNTKFPEIKDELNSFANPETCCRSLECKVLSYFKRKAYKDMNISMDAKYID